ADETGDTGPGRVRFDATPMPARVRSQVQLDPAGDQPVLAVGEGSRDLRADAVVAEAGIAQRPRRPPLAATVATRIHDDSVDGSAGGASRVRGWQDKLAACVADRLR